MEAGAGVGVVVESVMEATEAEAVESFRGRPRGIFLVLLCVCMYGQRGVRY